MQILDLKQMDITQSKFYQEIAQENRQDQTAKLVLRQLARRIGTLSSEQTNQIKDLSVPQLEELAEALLDFRAINDFENFLSTLKP